MRAPAHTRSAFPRSIRFPDNSAENVERRQRRRLSTFALKRDEIKLNRHRALALSWSMIFSENRYTLFQIML